MPPATYPIPSYAGNNAPTPAQISNRQLTYSVSPSSSQTAPPGTAGTDVGGNEQAARALSDYLNTGNLSPQESAYEGTIMGNYNQAKQNTSTAYQGEAQSITNDYQNQLDQLNRDLGNQMTGELESRSGFATNNAMLRNLSETGQNRIDQLTKQRDEALLNNNAQMADSLNNLIINEQNVITNARQNMVENMKTAATLQTPEQQVMLEQQKAQQDAVVQLMTQAPDAGITSSDTYDEAVAKYKNSNYYKANIGQAEQTLANLQKTGALTSAQQAEANAAAAASAASAAQTRLLTGYMGGNNGGSGSNSLISYYADQLKQNASNPKSGMSPNDVLTALGSFGAAAGGMYQQALQQSGISVAGANLGNTAAENTNNIYSTGNIYGEAGVGANNFLTAFGSRVGLGSGTSGTTPRSLTPVSSGNVIMSGPGGTYSVPKSQVAAMQAQGYH